MTSEGGLVGYVYALLFGANGSVNKVVLEAGITPGQLTLMRSLAVAVLGGAALLMTNRAALRVSVPELFHFAVLGVVGVAMVQWFYAMALSRMPVGIALLIEYTAILMVAVVARFVFSETVKPRLWVAIACVLAGLAVVAKVWSTDLPVLGVALASLAAVSFAAYLLLGEHLVTRTSPLAAAFWSMVFASLFWGIFSGWWQMDAHLFTQRMSLGGHLSGTVVPLWVLVCYVMLLGSAAPFMLSFMALGRLPATPVGIVSTTEIVFAFAVAWMWLGEALDSAQLSGAIIVLVGVAIAQTARGAATRVSQEPAPALAAAD